jgi:MerR family mercuric resistance operon transcriptional regulator
MSFPLDRVTGIIDVEPKCKVKPLYPFLFWGPGRRGKHSQIRAYFMSATKQFTISQLAQAARIPVSTIRYYERIRLLTPEHRTAGNYRLYSDASLRRLRFICAAHAIGFTLEDIKTLLGSPGGKKPTCHNVQSLIAQRLSEIEGRLKDLRHVKRVLNTAFQKCLETESDGCCHVIESLNEGSARPV